MTKIDIFSGFLGAGKTTLIKKLIREAYAGEKIVLIENEFGEIGIDGGFLQDAGIEITEMNSGCICCSLVGDFGEALKKVLSTYHPERILIEPSGVGKLSDVIAAVQKIHSDEIVLNSFTTVADATKCRLYAKNFGEFYNNQIAFANTVIFSRTDGMSEEKLAKCLAIVREQNQNATIVTTPWDQLDGKQILAVMEHRDTLDDALRELLEDAEHEHEHHHHHHDEDEDSCCCGHHHHDHDDDDDDDEHEHHHEHHHDHEHEHEHEHDHEHGDSCCCGHDHDHEHHHHADEVFTSWGVETARAYTKKEISDILAALEDEGRFGFVLRAKGIIPAQDGTWIHFDYVPGCPDVRSGSAGAIGRLCVIGSKLKEDALAELFRVK